MEKTLDKLSRELKLPKEEILDAYKAYWKFIRNKIKELPLKEDLDEEQFSKLRTNFNIPKLGKLHCTYPRYKAMKTLNKRREDAKCKESQIDVQLYPHNQGGV
jgi:uncharacterized protein YktA (UPF0223 family)